MSNMKYPPVEHVRHINPTRADLFARIFIVGYPPVKLKGNRNFYVNMIVLLACKLNAIEFSVRQNKEK